MPTRNWIWLACLVAGSLVFSTGQAHSDQEEPDPSSYGSANDNSGMIAAPVHYKNQMLVAVTAKGVAGVVFDEAIDKQVRYRFRYLKNGATEEIVGEGTIFERYTDGKYDGGELTIKAGETRIGWSMGGEKQGWVYYKPEDLQLHLASAERFEDQGEGVRLEGSRKVEKLDLTRFLKRP